MWVMMWGVLGSALSSAENGQCSSKEASPYLPPCLVRLSACCPMPPWHPDTVYTRMLGTEGLSLGVQQPSTPGLWGRVEQLHNPLGWECQE